MYTCLIPQLLINQCKIFIFTFALALLLVGCKKDTPENDQLAPIDKLEYKIAFLTTSASASVETGTYDLKTITHLDKNPQIIASKLPLHVWLSPDWTKVAYQYFSQTSTDDIHFQDVLTGERSIMPFNNGAVLQFLDWNPNSDQILYSRSPNDESGNEILVYDLIQNTNTLIFNAGIPFIEFARWAPDGNNIMAVVSTLSETSEVICIEGIDYSPKTIASSISTSEVQWLNSNTVYFWEHRTPTQLVKIDRDGNNSFTLPLHDFSKISISPKEICYSRTIWQPDANTDPFESKPDQDYYFEFSTTNLIGENNNIIYSSNLEHLNEFHTTPKWSPDGKYLLFSRDGDLLIMDRNGEQIRKIYDHDPADSSRPRATGFYEWKYL